MFLTSVVNTDELIRVREFYLHKVRPHHLKYFIRFCFVKLS